MTDIQTYQLVHDERDVITFFNFIQDPGEMFNNKPRQVITQILARKKYAREISKSTRQIVRRLNRMYKGEDLVNVLRKYEVKAGLYSCKDINHETYILESDNIAVYATVNRLDSFKAAKKLINSIHSQMFEACTNGNVQNLHEECGNIDRNFMSHMMSASTFEFIHLDIDEKEEGTLEKVKDVYSQIVEGYSPNTLLLETTNGYHMLINVRAEVHKKCIERAYKIIGKIKDFDISITDKGSPCPIPGTYQAGFPVRITHFPVGDKKEQDIKNELTDHEKHAEDKSCGMWC